MTPARLAVQRGVFVCCNSLKPHGLGEFFVGGRRKKTRKHTRSIWMKLTTLAAALAGTLAFAQTAHAREHRHRQGLSHRSSVYPEAGRHWVAHRYSATRDTNYKSAWSYRNSATEAFAWSAQSAYHGGYGGRPRAWCGWQMRQLVGGDPGPQFNLARNWARWGQTGPAGIGAVVVWPHHVGKIAGQEGGMWIIQSGNDGNRVRTRPLSIGGAIAIRWG
jgi:hypothetical protein